MSFMCFAGSVDALQDIQTHHLLQKVHTKCERLSTSHQSKPRRLLKFKVMQLRFWQLQAVLDSERFCSHATCWKETLVSGRIGACGSASINSVLPKFFESECWGCSCKWELGWAQICGSVCDWSIRCWWLYRNVSPTLLFLGWCETMTKIYVVWTYRGYKKCYLYLF